MDKTAYLVDEYFVAIRRRAEAIQNCVRDLVPEHLFLRTGGRASAHRDEHAGGVKEADAVASFPPRRWHPPHRDGVTHHGELAGDARFRPRLSACHRAKPRR